MSERSACATFCPLTLVLACVILCRGVIAGSCASPSPSAGATPSISPLPWHHDRYFYYSNKAPVINALKTVPGFTETVDRTLEILRTTEDNILDSQKARFHGSSRSRFRPQQPRNARRRDSLLPTCNLEDKVWDSAAASLMKGVFNRNYSSTCVTNVFPEEQEERAWYDVISAFRSKLNASARLINQQAGAEYPNPDTVYNFPFVTSTETCLINAIGAYRLDDAWYVNVAITNELKSKHLEDHGRLYLIEYMGSNGTHANMTLREPSNGYQMHSDASTLHVNDSGSGSPNFFKPTPFTENIALIRALDKVQLYWQQAHDATSLSSIFILFLPLFLNILPIAMFADVTRLSMLFYSLLSDILTTVPLAIKGVELIHIGSTTTVGVVIRMTSFHNGTRPTEAGAEVFLASCQTKAGVYNAGIAFLVIAIAFMVVGLILEVVVRQLVAQRRMKLT